MHSNNDNTMLYKICIVYDFKQKKNFSKLILRYLVWSHKRFNIINRESLVWNIICYEVFLLYYYETSVAKTFQKYRESYTSN